MSNSLNVLIPVVIASMQRVLRQTGAIFNCFNVNGGVEAAAVGQSVTLPETAVQATYTVTPGPTAPALVDTTPASKTLTISAYKGTRFHLTGEDWRAIGARGPDFRARQIDECFAALVHEAAAYAFGIAEAGCGRAVGAQGTSPFGSNVTNLVDAWKILADQKAPVMGRVGALSTTDWAAASSLATFQKANEAPAGVLFNTLSLGTLANFALSYDQAVQNHTTSTATGYAVNGAAAIGDSTITVDTGTGSWVAGDVIHATGDTANKYVVASATATVITLRSPLVAAIADDVVLVKQATHRANILCHPDAFALAIRPPAEAPEGDAADAVQIVSDPVTGLALRLAHYKGYHAGQWEMSWVYGGVARRPALAVKVIG